MKQEEEKSVGLPDNAFRPLKPGEQYHPIMSPNKKYPEVNLWSVLWGIAMAVLFSAAAAYLGLKVGQVFEAAIPIAIIAVGVSGAAKRKNALGENVIIQIHRRLFGSHSGRSHLHIARPLYIAGQIPRNDSQLLSDVCQLTAGRCFGNPVPHPLP